MDKNFAELMVILKEYNLISIYITVCDKIGVDYYSNQAWDIGIALIKTYTLAINDCTAKIDNL